MGLLIATSKGVSWFRKGHPWIFRNDLAKIQDAAPGSIVSLEDKNGKFLAQGFYSEHSKIAFRLVSRSQEPIRYNFWKDRMERAFRYRQTVVEQTNAHRLIYGESDGIPSLIIDRYGDHFVIQTLSQATENLLDMFVKTLLELFRPSSIILRNDLSVRELEGLPQEKKVILGECPAKVQVFEGNIQYRVDLWNGQKTGAYLDQRENRILSARFLRGRVLDAFCYHGLFALHAAGKATRVIGVDSSKEAIEQASENALLNGLPNVDFRKENVFDFLKAEVDSGQNYDGIILDPPAFAKSKENIRGAARGYKELNLRAIRLLNPGGIFITSSCSYNLSETKFLEVLKECAKDSGAILRIIERRGQSADHPILLSFPESYYLKCLFLEKFHLASPEKAYSPNSHSSFPLRTRKVSPAESGP
ncbi:MAG: class I SAM-dependent rRNA methyltransferase [Deltaproteobacteria bacterium]|nr:class I SAM-dependent rRNA methyltransferase [Deltaproteobacteria bacterium]